MIPRVSWLAVLTAAVPPDTDPLGSLIGLFITSIISTGVLAALVTGVVQYLINRRNSRVTERKNAVDAESDLVSRYKEAAIEERSAKESAVKTIRELLAASEEQVQTLRDTVITLNNTIERIGSLTNAQADEIVKLTADRDKTQASLERAEIRIEEQRQELIKRQQEILELTKSHSEAVRTVKETFGFEDYGVE